MSENVSDGWACNCPPGSDPEACFCMYANGTLMAEVTQADYDALLAERDAALDRARRAEETRENANAVSVRVELENRRLVAERDALRGAGKQINHHLERAKVFLDSERYATCGQEIAGAHAALLAAWRAATGKDA